MAMFKGAFTNYVCTWGWVGGQQNAYLCLHRVRGSFENVYVNKTKNCEFFTFSLFYIYTELCRGSQSCFWDFHINLKEKILSTGAFFGGGPKSCQKIKHYELLDRLLQMEHLFWNSWMISPFEMLSYLC